MLPLLRILLLLSLLLQLLKLTVDLYPTTAYFALPYKPAQLLPLSSLHTYSYLASEHLSAKLTLAPPYLPHVGAGGGNVEVASW